MKEIFKKIEGREWDWFGEDEDEVIFEVVWNGVFGEVLTGKMFFSLADLLANKSWCKAVWGELDGSGCGCNDPECCPTYTSHSIEVFQMLQHEGEKACIEYIKKTMI